MCSGRPRSALVAIDARSYDHASIELAGEYAQMTATTAIVVALARPTRQDHFALAGAPELGPIVHDSLKHLARTAADTARRVLERPGLTCAIVGLEEEGSMWRALVNTAVAHSAGVLILSSRDRGWGSWVGPMPTRARDLPVPIPVLMTPTRAPTTAPRRPRRGVTVQAPQAMPTLRRPAATAVFR